MTTVDILTQARDLIADPSHWTTATFAVNASNQTTDPCNPLAVAWCAVGALQHITSQDLRLMDPADVLLCRVGKELYGYTDITGVNDHCGHEAVLHAFDTAITRVRADA